MSLTLDLGDRSVRIVGHPILAAAGFQPAMTGCGDTDKHLLWQEHFGYLTVLGKVSREYASKRFSTRAFSSQGNTRACAITRSEWIVSGAIRLSGSWAAAPWVWSTM